MLSCIVDDLQRFHWSTNNSAERQLYMKKLTDKGSVSQGEDIHFLLTCYNPIHLVMSNEPSYQANLKQALLAGAMAGTAVDTALFPLGNNRSLTTKRTRVSCHWSLTCTHYRHDQNTSSIAGRLYCFWWFSWCLLWPSYSRDR